MTGDDDHIIPAAAIGGSAIIENSDAPGSVAAQPMNDGLPAAAPLIATTSLFATPRVAAIHPPAVPAPPIKKPRGRPRARIIHAYEMSASAASSGPASAKDDAALASVAGSLTFTAPAASKRKRGRPPKNSISMAAATAAVAVNESVDLKTTGGPAAAAAAAATESTANTIVEVFDSDGTDTDNDRPLKRLHRPSPAVSGAAASPSDSGVSATAGGKVTTTKSSKYRKAAAAASVKDVKDQEILELKAKNRLLVRPSFRRPISFDFQPTSKL